MRAPLFLLASLSLATPVAAQRQALGIFAQWGAFQEKGRCFAIAEPAHGPRPEGPKPFASVGYWPERGASGQLYIRLSQEKRAGSAVLLRIDERTWQLLAGGSNAWAAEPRA